VLSGAAMKVAENKEQLVEYLGNAAAVNPAHPVVITKFIEGAREIEVDAIASKGTLVNWAISEHVENAGVHSGDATMILPSDTISSKLHNRLRTITGKIAVALQISGPMNVQYIVKGDDVKEPADIKVIECNLRASRSLPFVSKTYDIDFIETATRVFLGEDPEPNGLCDVPPKHVCVKFPMFSFQRLLGADPVLGVEMASTGEVACFGENKYEAFLKSMNSIPSLRVKAQAKTVLLSGALGKDFAPSANALVTMGWKLFATPETAQVLNAAKIPFTAVSHEDALKNIQKKQIEIHLNFPTKTESAEQYTLRRKTVDFATPLITNPQVAAFWIAALEKSGPLLPKSWQDYFPNAVIPGRE